MKSLRPKCKCRKLCGRRRLHFGLSGEAKKWIEARGETRERKLREGEGSGGRGSFRTVFQMTLKSPSRERETKEREGDARPREHARGRS